MITKEAVHVEGLSKFGFKANGVYYNWSGKLDEDAKGKVVPGGTYDMTIYVSDGGKKYVNAVLGAGKPTAAPATRADISKPSPVDIGPVAVSTYTGRDFDKEARGKTKCAVFCAALQSPFAATFGTQKELEAFIGEMVELGVKTSFGD